jgi:hypothetical protein
MVVDRAKIERLEKELEKSGSFGGMRSVTGSHTGDVRGGEGTDPR